MAESDIESGQVQVTSIQLNPAMVESPDLLWAFIRKVNIILSLQMILTVGVSSIVFFVDAIPDFITKTKLGLAILSVSLVVPFLVFGLLRAFVHKHPINFIILSLFSLSASFSVGLFCSFSQGIILLETSILTAVMVLGITIYTFWAAKKGHDLTFRGPFLFGAFFILVTGSLMLLFFPLGSMIISSFESIFLCGFIISQLISKIHNYDEYISAALSASLFVFLFLVFLMAWNELISLYMS